MTILILRCCLFPSLAAFAALLRPTKEEQNLLDDASWPADIFIRNWIDGRKVTPSASLPPSKRPLSYKPLRPQPLLWTLESRPKTAPISKTAGLKGIPTTRCRSIRRMGLRCGKTFKGNCPSGCAGQRPVNRNKTFLSTSFSCPSKRNLRTFD